MPFPRTASTHRPSPTQRIRRKFETSTPLFTPTSLRSIVIHTRYLTSLPRSLSVVALMICAAPAPTSPPSGLKFKFDQYTTTYMKVLAQGSIVYEYFNVTGYTGNIDAYSFAVVSPCHSYASVYGAVLLGRSCDVGQHLAHGPWHEHRLRYHRQRMRWQHRHHQHHWVYTSTAHMCMTYYTMRYRRAILRCRLTHLCLCVCVCVCVCVCGVCMCVCVQQWALHPCIYLAGLV